MSDGKRSDAAPSEAPDGQHNPSRNLDFDLAASRTLLSEAVTGAMDDGLAELERLGDATLRHMMVAMNLSDMRNADLSGLDLRGEDLSEIDFEGADFADADLRKCDFTKANLRNANLIGAKLDGAIFERASLEGARVEQIRSVTVHPKLR